MTYRLSRTAGRDVQQIYSDGKDRFGSGQAKRYVASLYTTFERLAAFPYLARERTELNPPIRVHPSGAHMIVYRAEGEDVLILRIRHGHEDWQAG